MFVCVCVFFFALKLAVNDTVSLLRCTLNVLKTVLQVIRRVCIHVLNVNDRKPPTKNWHLLFWEEIAEN